MTTERLLGDDLDRVRAEYRQLPGLSLTKAQARRLWRLDEPTCDRLFDTLVETHFLWKAQNDCYVRPEFSHAPDHLLAP
jgi:hypothetical protein